MSERGELQFAGNVPEAYDKHLVAPLYEPMAHVLLAAIGLKAGERLLDVACGREAWPAWPHDTRKCTDA